MRANTAGFKSPERPTTIALPNIKKELINKKSNNKKSSKYFKSLSQEDLLSPDSNVTVRTWLFDQPEPNKHVQFAHDISNTQEKTVRHRLLAFSTSDSLPDIDQHVHNLDLTPFNQSVNDHEDDLLKNHENHLASLAEAKLHRSSSYKTFSITSTTPSTRLHHPSFSSSPPLISHPAPSIDIQSSITSTSTTRDRASNLSLLEINSSLSEYDRKKFDDIRQQVPEEFEQLLPTLFKLGVVLWPKKLLDNNEQLTANEMRQGQRFIKSMEKDQQEYQRQRYLQSLYGGVLPYNDILRKYHLLRETLSFPGQLSLLGAYRDEIENELRKRYRHRRAIPMKSHRTNCVDDTNSINKSSILSNTFQAKQKFLRLLSTRTNRSTTNSDQGTNEDLFLISSLPDKIDQQWQRKSLVKIIEQGMNILDQARKLPVPSLANRDDDYDIKGTDVVRTFERWLFLCSTLFTEDKSLR